MRSDHVDTRTGDSKPWTRGPTRMEVRDVWLQCNAFLSVPSKARVSADEGTSVATDIAFCRSIRHKRHDLESICRISCAWAYLPVPTKFRGFCGEHSAPSRALLKPGSWKTSPMGCLCSPEDVLYLSVQAFPLARTPHRPAGGSRKANSQCYAQCASVRFVWKKYIISGRSDCGVLQ